MKMDRTARQMAKWIYAGRGRNFHFSVANCTPRLSGGDGSSFRPIFFVPNDKRRAQMQASAKAGSLMIIRVQTGIVSPRFAVSHANLFLIDGIAASSAYECLINAPSRRHVVERRDAKNIRAGFIRRVCFTTVNGKSGARLQNSRFPFPRRWKHENIAKRAACQASLSLARPLSLRGVFIA